MQQGARDSNRLSRLFPLRPTCRMSGEPLMCPRDAVHYFQGVVFYGITSNDNFSAIFGAKKYASGEYRQKYQPMWKNMDK